MGRESSSGGLTSKNLFIRRFRILGQYTLYQKVIVFFDQPVRGGDGFTLQAGFTHWDGGTFLSAIPKQNTTLVETGYYFRKARLQPYLQYARQHRSTADEQRPQVGLGYYFVGHNSNLKLAYTRIDKRGAKKRNQVQLQYQSSRSDRAHSPASPGSKRVKPSSAAHRSRERESRSSTSGMGRASRVRSMDLR